MRSRQVQVYIPNSETIWQQFTDSKEYCKCCPTSLIFISSSLVFSFEFLKLSIIVSVIINCWQDYCLCGQHSKIKSCSATLSATRSQKWTRQLKSNSIKLQISRIQLFIWWLTSALRNHFSLVERKHAISSPFKTDIKVEKAEGLVESCVRSPSSRNWLWQLRVASIIR